MKIRIKRLMCLVMVVSMILGCLVVKVAATGEIPKDVARRASGSFKITVKPGIIAKGNTKLPLDAGETVTVKASYPYKRNASGTYEYRYPSKTYPTKNSSTPGYYGNATLYASIIQLYNNTIGYFTHDESIDVTSAVASMLS